MKWLGAFITLLFLTIPAPAATDVWLFYGAGPHIFSSGINQIARKAKAINGVGRVSTWDYRSTQAVYDQIRASPTSDHKVIVGYSCGGNAALVIAQSLASSGTPVNILLMQPSVWCGWYLPTTSNVTYAQDTYAGCLQTFGLGCLRIYGSAQRNVNIFRPENHLRADTDPDYQRDVLNAINCIANPSRCGRMRHLPRTADVTLYVGQSNYWNLHGN